MDVLEDDKAVLSLLKSAMSHVGYAHTFHFETRKGGHEYELGK